MNLDSSGELENSRNRGEKIIKCDRQESASMERLEKMIEALTEKVKECEQKIKLRKRKGGEQKCAAGYRSLNRKLISKRER